MEEDDTQCLASTIEDFDRVALFLIDYLSIYILGDAVINLYPLECSCLIAMQHIVHIAAGKFFDGLVQEVRSLPHRCLYICLHQVNAEGIAELDGYHVAAGTRP